MLAAILCPGPSLAKLDEVPRADIIVAVNRAAIRWQCDAWACLDHWSINDGGIRGWQGQVIGSPQLVTSRGSFQALASHQCPWRGGVMLIDDLLAWLPLVPGKSWTLYTATAALAYTAWRGAKRIEVYGADMVGTLDYDGVAAGSKRHELRWEGEREIWRATVEQLGERGVEVVRHG